MRRCGVTSFDHSLSKKMETQRHLKLDGVRDSGPNSQMRTAHRLLRPRAGIRVSGWAQPGRPLPALAGLPRVRAVSWEFKAAREGDRGSRALFPRHTAGQPRLVHLMVTVGFPRAAREDKHHAQELSKSLRVSHLLLGHQPNQITWPIPDGDADWASR